MHLPGSNKKHRQLRCERISVAIIRNLGGNGFKLVNARRILLELHRMEINMHLIASAAKGEQDSDSVLFSNMM